MSSSSGARDALNPLDRARVENDPRWAAVQRILASPGFLKSARLSAFLIYVCECAILGRVDEVSEQHVGIHVFERPPDYNASEDNIVRSHARLLRRKLDEYYAEEGRQEAIRIQVPKGAYLPVFGTVSDPEPEAPPEVAPPVRRRPALRWWAAGVLVLAVVGYAVYRWTTPSRPQMLVRQFWGQVFNADRPTMVVSSDTALVLFEGYTRSSVALSEYLARDFWQKFPPQPDIQGNWISGLRDRPFTNNVDLSFCWRLARQPSIDFRRAVVRPSRELGMADLKGANAVLIGARRANPWVELFDQKNNFQGLFTEELRDYIQNRAPHGSELPVYRWSRVEGATHSYALIEFNRGLTSNEHVLILSGLNTPGTEGAADFLLNPSTLGRFLETITLSDDRVPHFELLLGVDNINVTAPRAEVVAYRVQKD
ncbi:hypothetical protein [uncultured Paludibaculum sp.]|uniref:hypothetical protein n=1 Tax=uncultured Paludibaculum sp. TaxID=1765020 RepID=UPI002AAC0FAD|nr:hypothetical protein [uncultured Paludibaculum sp.]